MVSKTLYVDATMMTISSDEFKKEYPYPFAFVTGEELAAKTSKREKGAVYLKTDAYEGLINLMMVDASTGAILARIPMSDVNASSNNASGFSVENNLSQSSSDVVYQPCFNCPHLGGEVITTYLTKTKVKKGIVKSLINDKKQISSVRPLTIY
jgi:hypothetical protein